MNLIQEMGFKGPIRLMSAEDKKAYRAEYERRNRHRWKEDQREKNRLKRLANPEFYRKQKRDWEASNQDKVKKYRKLDWATNKEERKLGHNEWIKNNRSRVHAKRNARHKIRMQTEPGYKILRNQRTRLNELIKAKNLQYSYTLKLTSDTVKEHLERKFKVGMTWQNYGTEWVCDHIIPCASFDLTKPEDLATCFSIHNLQPLWKKENRDKWHKLPTQSEMNLSS